MVLIVPSLCVCAPRYPTTKNAYSNDGSNPDTRTRGPHTQLLQLNESDENEKNRGDSSASKRKSDMRSEPCWSRSLETS